MSVHKFLQSGLLLAGVTTMLACGTPENADTDVAVEQPPATDVASEAAGEPEAAMPIEAGQLAGDGAATESEAVSEAELEAAATAEASNETGSGVDAGEENAGQEEADEEPPLN